MHVCVLLRQVCVHVHVCVCLRCSVEQLETSIARLISSGALAARLDADLKVLHSFTQDIRSAVVARVLRAGDEFLEQATVQLLRSSFERHGLVVKAPLRSAEAGGDYETAAAPGSS